MNVIVITPPTTEPVSVATARRRLRITHDADDQLLADLIRQAREECEQYIEQSVARQTLELVLDRFPPDEIELPRPPIASIVSVRYVDTEHVQQTVDPGQYVLDNASRPGWLLPAVEARWPETACVVNAVRVRYLAGNDPGDLPLPDSLANGILLMVQADYEGDPLQRQTVRRAAETLWQPYRLGMGV